MMIKDTNLSCCVLLKHTPCYARIGSSHLASLYKFSLSSKRILRSEFANFMGYDTVSIGNYLLTFGGVLYFNFHGSKTLNLKIQGAPKC